MTQHTSPTRIVTIDALRGFALLGILFAHFIYWHSGGPLPATVYQANYGPGSTVAAVINMLFIFGKFYTFFAFLFGLSFYLQMQSLQKQGENFKLRYAWRLTILLAIGLLHHSYWMGDILSIYAVLGFALIAMKNLSNRTLLIVGMLLVLNLPGKMWDLVNLLFIHTKNPDESQAIAIRYQQMIEHGTIKDLIVLNWQALKNKFYFQVFSGRLFITLGFFILGTYTGRKKWFENLPGSKPIFKNVCKRAAFIVLVTIVIAAAIFFTNQALRLQWEKNEMVMLFFGILFDINSAAMVLFYLSGLTMLMYRQSWQQVLYPLAPVGKMALTSYLTQTVFGLLLFYHVGFGLFMKTTPGWNWIIAIGIYLLQVIFSRWWFRYFKYGPVEWLWRSGTMLHWQPFLKTKSREQATPALTA